MWEADAPPQPGEAAPETRHGEASGPDTGPAAGSAESLRFEGGLPGPLGGLSKLPLVREPREAPENRRLYLLQTLYDGDRGVAAAKLYDPEAEEIYIHHDGSGYKPYFLTDIPPDKLQEIPAVVRHPGFDHIEVVEKFDLLRWQRLKATKIVVKTPDVVPALRDKVPRAWEANIKFHHNYIYDKALIPGMIHRVEKGELRWETVQLTSEEEEHIRSIFEGEDKDTVEMAVKWYPLFEQEPPRPRRLAVDIEVYTPFKGRIPDANKASYPVISVAFASDEGWKAVFILARPGLTAGHLRGKLPEGTIIEIFDDERAMLLETFRIIANYPIVLTFNGDSFDFTYLYNRALKLGIDRSLIPFRFSKNYISLRYGLHIDLYKFFSTKAIQTYAFGNAYKEFTLDAIASALLGEHKVEVEASISDLGLLELARYNVRDAELTLKLTTFNDDLVWKLIILIMRISKLPIEDVTRSQVSAWVKSLLYWEHRRRDYLIPTREEIKVLKGKVFSTALIKGKKYQGALVLDPPSGVFFNVVVLDFASLYPSIIKKWNLSYETINPVECPGGRVVEIPDVGHKVCMSVPGITAQVVGLLRDYRVKIYKKRAKDKSLGEKQRAWYNTVQAAMKVYINASYGVFGAENFPFYSPALAESVTAIGRYTIKETLRKAAELGLFVLYGDTDSLFLWAPPEEALSELQEYVERNFGLDLEVDKAYRFVTFSGLKKNYIGVYMEGGVDVKGLVAKKRNTPEFLKKEFAEVLDILGAVTDPFEFVKAKNTIKQKLRGIYDKLRGLEYNLDELAVKMALNKPVSEYTKNTPQHVKAARQLIAAGIEVLPGDVISFVKVKGREGVKPVQLARLIEVDIEKYIETAKSIFEQVLAAIGLTWDEVIGAHRLEMFLFNR
ncbi:MAG: DNA-directed DNA polymerase I [Crenarchaeota archaeon]|nr:DNA-directed DNA polymerase I [Thermoproteota archaeon]